MVLDNDDETALRLTRMLRTLGHDPFVAEARYYLEDLQEHGPFHLVITEIFLKDISGLQVVLGVKGLDASIKVVAMSGGAPPALSDDYLDYAREFGADAVVRKPLDVERLDALLAGIGQADGPHRRPDASVTSRIV
ncbi:response regulator [Fundidesulfovibrio magnetotacticus]|nr:response regulator [Fundidesulfovibrio magnetotacticus]